MPLGDGRINDTFLVKTANRAYVLQHVTKKMDSSKLEYNYDLYSEACENANLLYPKLLTGRDGRRIHRDDGGESWRAYPFLEGDILQAPLPNVKLQAIGQGIAHLHECLRDLREKPKAVFPKLHDLTRISTRATAWNRQQIICNATGTGFMNEVLNHYDL